MYTDYIELETNYGPLYVVYNHSDLEWESSHPSFSQAVVKCPDNIVWDNTNGLWYPEPQVVDEALPKTRLVCNLLGVPPYEWLAEVRRDTIWAINGEFSPHRSIGSMMKHNQ